MDLPIVAEHLHVELALIEDEALQIRRADDDLCALRRGAAARLDGSEELNQRARIGVAEVRERGHAGSGKALAEQRPELLVCMRRHARRDAGPELAAVGVAAVAAG